MADFGLNEYSADAEDIARRRRYAEMLQQQAMQPLESQTAGGWVIPTSPLAGAAKLVQAYSARKGMDKAREDQIALGNRVSSDAASRYAQALKLYNGTPGQTIDLPGNEMGDAPTQATIAPQKGDAGAAGALLQGNPMTAPLAQAMMAQMLKANEPFNLRKDEKRYGPNGQVIATNEGPRSLHFADVGTEIQPLDSTTGAPVGAPVPKKNPNEGVWSAPYELGGAQVQKNSVTGEIRQAVSRPPITNVNTQVTNAGPKAFETALGGIDAKRLDEYRTNAETANNTLGVVQNLRTAINQGMFEGGGAAAKTAAANLISGITGAKIKALPGSQQFEAEAAKLVLDHVKALGSNPSNADRDFIEKTVPMISTSPEARDKLINYIEQKAAKQIDLYKRADAHARKNHGLGGFDAFGGQPGSPDVDALLRKYQ